MELSKKQNDDISRICDTNPEYAVAIMTSFMDSLGMVSKSEFSKTTGINIRTVERNCKSGKIPCVANMPMVNVYQRMIKTC